MKCFKGIKKRKKKSIRKDALSNKRVPYFACIGLPPWKDDINYENMQTNYEDTLNVANRIIDMNSKGDKWHMHTVVTYQCSQPNV